MFRGCYFEFAGKSSEPFNLMLFYLNNDRDNFDSGGNFGLKTDSIPYTHEQFLYGKDYSENPLEFEVEIVTPEGNIPQTKMIEIKNWLFGQDGWRDLTVTDDTQSYHLKCVLVPSEDITDCNGYRGVRCTIHNASPFWYGEEKEITLSYSDLTAHYDPPSKWFGWNEFMIEIPNNDYVDCEIYPTIIINTNRTRDNMYTYGGQFHLTNTDVSTLEDGYAKTADGKHYLNKETSRISFDNSYLENTMEVHNYSYSYDSENDKHLIIMQYSGGQFSIELEVDSTPTDEEINRGIRHAGYHSLTYDSENKTGTAIYAKDNVTVNTKYVTVQSEQCPNTDIITLVNTDLPVPIFRLRYGTNICRIYYGYAYDSITFKYTPMYRTGAF